MLIVLLLLEEVVVVVIVARYGTRVEQVEVHQVEMEPHISVVMGMVLVVLKQLEELEVTTEGLPVRDLWEMEALHSIILACTKVGVEADSTVEVVVLLDVEEVVALDTLEE